MRTTANDLPGQLNETFTSLNKYLRSPFFWIAFIYILSAKGHLELIDTEYSVRTAKAIIENGSMRIKPVDPEFIKVSVNPTEEGFIYSQYGLGLPVLFIPFITLGKLLSSILDKPEDIVISFLLSFYNIPFALLGLWFIKGILLKLGRNAQQANATVTIIAVATAYWPYTVTDFSEVTQITFLLGALFSILLKEVKKWRLFSFCFALLVSMKLAYLIFLPLFFAYALYESRKNSADRFKVILNGLTFLLPMGIILGYANYVRFGSIFEAGYGANPGIGFGINYFIRTGLPSIFSMEYGIIPFNPVLLTVPLWLRVLKANKSFAILCIMLIATWFCLMCSYSYGWGWGWGQRYIFVIIPLSVICLAFAKQSNSNNLITAAITLIIVISCLIQLIATSTKFHEPLTIQLRTEDRFEGPYRAQLPATILLFSHKLINGSTNYPLTIIGGEKDEYVDLSEYESFRGFNFWPVHALKIFNLQEYERFLGIFILSIISFIQFRLMSVQLPNLFSCKKPNED